MEQSTSILVISGTTFADIPHERAPFVHLILPVDRVPKSLYFPTCPVWWAEIQKGKVWLRGYAQVDQVTEESLLDGTLRRLVWHLVPETSERLTSPGRSAAPAAEISRLVQDKTMGIACGFWVRETTAELALELENRKARIAEDVWSYDAARRHYERLVREAGFSSRAVELSGDLEKSWAFARTQFARAELVQLPGRDAYEVAAAALAGLEEMPTLWTPNSASNAALLYEESLFFHELNPEDVLFVEKTWRASCGASGPGDALERSGRRHQLIVKSLAKAILVKGLYPTYNRFVDLRVALPDQDVFFEVKTTTPDNYLHQIRLAAGQLLEYRFRYRKQNGDKPIKLVAVVEDSGSDADNLFAGEFLGELGISLLNWNASCNSYQSLAEMLN